MGATLRATLGWVCFAALAVALSASASERAIEITRLSPAPVIDGDLSDACWRDASRTGAFYSTKTSSSGVIMLHGVADVQTRVRIGYDDRNLYLAFECMEPATQDLKMDGTRRDYGVIKDDHIEVFLQPDTAVGDYDHFGLTPNALKYDQRVTATEGKDYVWSPDWQAKARVLDNRWIAELAIPFAVINHAGPQMGRAWGILLARDRKAAREASCWPEIKGMDWHCPANWGAMSGLILGATGKGLDIAGCDVGVPTVGHNDVLLSLVNRSAAKLEVTANVKVSSPGGAVHSSEGEPGVVDAGAEKRVRLPYDIYASEGTHTVDITFADTTGAVVCKAPPIAVDIPAFITGFLDRSYYSTEAAATATVLLDSLQPAMREQCRVRGRIIADGDNVWNGESALPLGEKAYLAATLTDIPLGRHTFNVILENSDGDPLSTVDLDLRKLTPLTEGTESKIWIRDKGDAVVLVDGRPFLPLGLFHMRVDFSEQIFADAAQAGFNEIIHWRSRGVEALRRELDIARNNGIYMIAEAKRLVPRPKDRSTELSYAMPARHFHMTFVDYWIPHLEEKVPQVAGHPALIGWNQFDEAGPRFAATTMLFTRTLHRLDPYHIVVACTDFNVEGAEKLGEVFRNDAYLYTHKPMAAAYHEARKWVEAATRCNKVPDVTIQIRTTSQQRPMRYDEMRCNVFLVLIAGARGLNFFGMRASFLEPWEAIKKVVSEVRDISDILLAPSVVQDFSVSQGRTKAVFARLFRKGDEHYLMAANSSVKPVSASFTIRGLEQETRLTEVYSGKTLSAGGDEVQVDFNPYEVVVYRMKREE